MNCKIVGVAILGLVLAKVASNHGMGAAHGGAAYGPRSHLGRHRDPNDPRRQWIREFHRSLHDADEADAAATSAGSTGAGAQATNPATAG